MRRTDLPVAEGELDADLVRSVKQASFMRQGFYVVVLLVALAGQVSGAVEALRIPLIWAIPAVGALELGGIVVLANADVRRRLGERAVASRLLSAIIAAWAVAFNWLAHSDHLLGGFFAGMSALGYLVWLMHTENQRRDRLRAKGDLPPTTPAYELFGHWVRHPLLTMRAKSLAKAQPHLGLYDSLAEARSEVRRERRTSAISKVLHRKIRAAVDPTTADIAVAVYDLDEIATRLAAGADYDGLTALIAADLAPARLAPNLPLPSAHVQEDEPEPPIHAEASVEPTPAITSAPEPLDPDLQPRVDARALPPNVRSEIENVLKISRDFGTGSHRIVPAPASLLEDQLPTVTVPVQPSAPAMPETDAIVPAPAPRATRTRASSKVDTPTPSTALRKRVHAALDANVPPGDERDVTQLLDLAGSVLDLNDVERITAQSYVRSWKQDADLRRTAAPVAG